jgi:hypothetical protein
MRELVRTLRLPWWRLVLRVTLIVLVVALLIRLGVAWVLTVPVGALLIWAAAYDYSHKPRGGWRPAPMGSFAVINDVDPSFIINERGGVQVDPLGRTYAGPERVPTPEEQAALGGGEWRSLLWVVAELAVIAALLVLVVLLSR